MKPAIVRKLPQPLKWKALLWVMKARVLNMFQNWMNTKNVKKRLSSKSESPFPSVGQEVGFSRSAQAVTSWFCKKISRTSSRAVKTTPMPPIIHAIVRLMMKSVRGRGASFMTSAEGGSDASAMAAKVSMMRFTHSICVTVSGDSVPKKAPKRTMRQAIRLTVIWKRMKRRMLR